MNPNKKILDEFKEHFQEEFQVLKLLGSGTFGYVLSAIDLSTGAKVAIKVLDKGDGSSERNEKLRQEGQILSHLRHPNITKLKQMRESEQYILLIMELIEGGTLKDLIESKKGKGFADDEASSIMKSILSAVRYMHDKGFIHRDIKPENILIQYTQDEKYQVKIADFGLSAPVLKGGYKNLSLSYKCGTLPYMAPEMAQGSSHSKPVDIWSCGVIMYILLEGKHPCYKKDETREQFITKIQNPEWEFGEKFCSQAKDLYLHMMDVVSYERYTAESACNHPWITRNFSKAAPLSLNERMQQFKQSSNMIRIIKTMYLFYKMDQNASEIMNNRGYLEKVNQQIIAASHTSQNNNSSAKKSIQSRTDLDSLLKLVNGKSAKSGTSLPDEQGSPVQYLKMPRKRSQTKVSEVKIIGKDGKNRKSLLQLSSNEDSSNIIRLNGISLQSGETTPQKKPKYKLSLQKKEQQIDSQSSYMKTSNMPQANFFASNNPSDLSSSYSPKNITEFKSGKQMIKIFSNNSPINNHTIQKIGFHTPVYSKSQRKISIPNQQSSLSIDRSPKFSLISGGSSSNSSSPRKEIKIKSIHKSMFFKDGITAHRKDSGANSPSTPNDQSQRTTASNFQVSKNLKSSTNLSNEQDQNSSCNSPSRKKLPKKLFLNMGNNQLLPKINNGFQSQQNTPKAMKVSSIRSRDNSNDSKASSSSIYKQKLVTGFADSLSSSPNKKNPPSFIKIKGDQFQSGTGIPKSPTYTFKEDAKVTQNKTTRFIIKSNSDLMLQNKVKRTLHEAQVAKLSLGKILQK